MESEIAIEDPDVNKVSIQILNCFLIREDNCPQGFPTPSARLIHKGAVRRNGVDGPVKRFCFLYCLI